MFVLLLQACGHELAASTQPGGVDDACTQPLLASPQASVPVIEERAWWEQLSSRRPELAAQHTGTMRDPAYWALVIKPKYRDELLSTPGATWDTIVSREDTDALKARDRAWADALRAYAGTIQASSTLRGGASESTAGYAVRGGASFDAAGLHYKVFFDFKDFNRSLTGERVAGFAKELERRGFIGDFKIGLTPDTRFIYNQIIVHAPSVAMGLCVESVGLDWFGGELEHVARGLDVVVDGRPTDWHHFLLLDRWTVVPQEAAEYVDYQTPIPRAICPADAPSEAGAPPSGPRDVPRQ
jgi:hypothetical protein